MKDICACFSSQKGSSDHKRAKFLPSLPLNSNLRKKRFHQQQLDNNSEIVDCIKMPNLLTVIGKMFEIKALKR